MPEKFTRIKFKVETVFGPRIAESETYASANMKAKSYKFGIKLSFACVFHQLHAFRPLGLTLLPPLPPCISVWVSENSHLRRGPRVNASGGELLLFTFHAYEKKVDMFLN